jgi:hypothetical protein
MFVSFTGLLYFILAAVVALPAINLVHSSTSAGAFLVAVFCTIGTQWSVLGTIVTSAAHCTPPRVITCGNEAGTIVAIEAASMTGLHVGDFAALRFNSDSKLGANVAKVPQ